MFRSFLGTAPLLRLAPGMAHRTLLLACCAALSGCIGVYGQDVGDVDSLKQAEDEEEEVAKEVPFEESLHPDLPVRQAKVTVDLAQRHQKLEGFGAAVAWYHDRILGETPEGLYEFLFPELGLDILRFRNRFERSDSSDENIAQEQEIFRRATQALGRKPKLLLSSWSPPARLKASGKEKCRGEADCTLEKKGGKFMYAEFADWWVRSIRHYQENGLAPDFVSMQNEPDFLPPDWEGCKFVEQETAEYPGYGKALAAFVARLGEVDPRPRVLGPEVLGIHYEKVQKYLAGLDPSHLDGVAHHLYEKGADDVWDWRDPGPDSYLDEMESVATATDKPIFQTEFGTEDDRGKDGGFEVAGLIHNSMTTEGAVAYLHWDLIWSEPGGLVSMRGRTPKPRDQYYSVRHFARYTDPGYQRVSAASDVPALAASAYVAPDQSRLTVVLLNKSRGVIEVELSPGEFVSTQTRAFQTSYRPGHSKRWDDLGGLPPKLRTPARSVTTVVFEK